MDRQDLLALWKQHDVQIGLAALLGILLTRLGIPTELQPHVIMVIAAIAVTLIGGKSYVAGKQAEGTVPEGSQGTGGKLVISVGGNSEPDQSLAPEVLEALTKLAAQIPTQDKPAEPTDPKSKTTMSIGIGLLLGMLCMLGVGCTSTDTSPLFQLGVSEAGPVLAQRASDYLTRDRALPPDVRQTDQQAIAAFKTATTDRTKVQFDAVDKSWPAVRDFYIQHVSGDDTLESDQQQNRKDTAAEFDGLIEQERSRRMSQKIPFL